ncbi:MAG TPA: hypothetical protein VJ885_06065 [Thermoanaerobaculia bacterium]|nr:hypothetical protein [Thermoanaerobaculia bacterium]
MTRKSALFGLVALLASVAPAMAGEVYVPFTSNRSIEGTTYRTKVWVTNTGTAGRRFETRFIAQGADGTQGIGNTTPVSVPGGGTVLLTNVAPFGGVGMLEVSGAPQLVVTARLDAIGQGEAILSSTHIPVVAPGNVVKGNSTAHMQGLERTSRGTVTDFGVMNLSNAASQCGIKTYRANGQQISQTAVISMQPLSVRHFDDILSVLGEVLVSDTRIEVSCDKQFFAYSSVYKKAGPEASFVTPSYALDGDLISGVGNSPGTVLFEVPGLFLEAKQGASFKQFEVPVVAGTRYKKATVEYDLYVNRYPNGLFTGVSSLRRTDRTLYYGLIVRGGREKTLIDMGNHETLASPSNGPWRERTNYHLVFEYDTIANRLTFKCYRNGTLVETLNGPIGHDDLTGGDGRKVRVDFGQTGVADHAYFPPIGWKYSNLKVHFEPMD